MLKLTFYGIIKNFNEIVNAKFSGDSFIHIEYDAISFIWMGVDLQVQYKSEGEIVATEDYFCVPADFTFHLPVNKKVRVHYEIE
ncbi:TPA: hypothetical protein DCG61_02580 [Patescibacteria group bacterium]|nr:hypothetical protein [Patescibacteria group bacterium]